MCTCKTLYTIHKPFRHNIFHRHALFLCFWRASSSSIIWIIRFFHGLHGWMKLFASPYFQISGSSASTVVSICIDLYCPDHCVSHLYFVIRAHKTAINSRARRINFSIRACCALIFVRLYVCSILKWYAFGVIEEFSIRISNVCTTSILVILVLLCWLSGAVLSGLERSWASWVAVHDW